MIPSYFTNNQTQFIHYLFIFNITAHISSNKDREKQYNNVPYSNKAITLPTTI